VLRSSDSQDFRRLVFLRLSISKEGGSLYIFMLKIIILHIVKMAILSVDLSLIKYIQILAKSDASKEDLTDSIAWFQGKYFVYFVISIK